MIYLAKLELNRRSRQVRAELADLYQMHRTLSKAFGEDTVRWQEARCLFRVEESSKGSEIRVLVQSQVEPDWEQMTVSPDYLAAPIEARAFDPKFAVGHRLAFRLRANPTIKRDGKRLGLYREDERLEWLQRKAEAGGFQIGSAMAQPDHRLFLRTSSGDEANFSAARFEGVLCVSDPQTLTQTLAAGIGSGKAFGFGLLSLARV